MEFLAGVMGVEVLAFSVMSNQASNKGWLDRAMGLASATPEEPEVDVCDLDFDEVCEELMMGASSS